MQGVRECCAKKNPFTEKFAENLNCVAILTRLKGQQLFCAKSVTKSTYDVTKLAHDCCYIR